MFVDPNIWGCIVQLYGYYIFGKNRKYCRNDKTTFFEKSIEKHKKPPQSRAAFVVFENIIFNMVGGAPVFEAHISDIWECIWMHADFLQ